LDKCKTIEEVKIELNKFHYKPIFGQLHYLIADRTGHTLIVEFSGSDFSFYNPDTTNIPILSNNQYKESLKYLKNFDGFGDDLPVLNRPGSKERFVSVANMLVEKQNKSSIDFAFQILDTVKQSDTKWSLVYVIKNLKVYFKLCNCNEVKVFDFKNLLKNQTLLGFGGNLLNCNFLNNNGFYHVNAEENQKLLEKVVFQYSKISGKPPSDNLLYQMEKIGRNYLFSGQ